MINENDKYYNRLVVARNEAKRRLKIKSINKTLSEEHEKKSMFAVASGICFSGIMVAYHFSGVDISQVIQSEIHALNFCDVVKEYLRNFTPAMWGTMIATVGSISKYVKHRNNYNKANQEFHDMIDNQLDKYEVFVESPVKIR